MLFEVEHTTRHDYSGPVGLEPLTIRLRPRADRWQYLFYFEMNLDPPPAGLSEATDLEGNDTALVWFEGQTTSLEISTRLQAETLRSNPFDYVVLEPERLQLPMRYPEFEADALARYLPSGAIAPSVKALAREVAEASGGDAPTFLTRLTWTLASELEGEVRLEGGARAPAETLRRGRGSCRDLTVLFMAACRCQGLATRFVSGYSEGDPDVPEKYLHAWPEVYLSGVGWRGFDPTLGLAVADRHLAVAAGPTPASAAAISGSYRGGADSSVKVTLDVRVSPSES